MTLTASKQSPRVAVAGGGLMGRLLAWRLALRGLDITLFEAGSLERPGGACWTAAGMISPLSELVHSERSVYELGLRSLVLWREWSGCLQLLCGSPVGFRQAGSVLVAHGRDRSELLHFQRELQAKLDAGELGQVRAVAATELYELEPALAGFEQGLFLAPEGDIDNRRLLPVLLEVLRRLRVSLREECPVACEPFTIFEGDRRQEFELVVDCRGLGARDRVPGLRGVRGEVLVVETAEVQLRRPVRLLHPRYQLYAVPRENGQTVIGATEIESEDMSPTSLRSCMELSSALYSLNPAFAEARILETRVNCRPATMDNLPVVEGEPGLVSVNGLYRHGYLLAPALAERVEQLAMRQVQLLA
ncbi:glycine oxidase ThiO [Microbulbifer sediminum]|uniref:glycine oxidase ThiO n=1 Tax=Microbulbifer sediminum TaxID=2904250 RepID=UPI001F00E738|nr:glycine oxidase ThiO [Microbulbifer sediminum]